MRIEASGLPAQTKRIQELVFGRDRDLSESAKSIFFREDAQDLSPKDREKLSECFSPPSRFPEGLKRRRNTLFAETRAEMYERYDAFLEAKKELEKMKELEKESIAAPDSNDSGSGKRLWDIVRLKKHDESYERSGDSAAQ
ncbi:MAG: hypothetical protein LBP24_04645 [Coriobacteriales bacterium]|jgi:hypothetical protein|nr:hypothetical protein [Coriobacteriales bacterium]